MQPGSDEVAQATHEIRSRESSGPHETSGSGGRVTWGTQQPTPDGSAIIDRQGWTEAVAPELFRARERRAPDRDVVRSVARVQTANDDRFTGGTKVA